jgi:hypothetical protein
MRATNDALIRNLGVREGKKNWRISFFGNILFSSIFPQMNMGICWAAILFVGGFRTSINITQELTHVQNFGPIRPTGAEAVRRKRKIVSTQTGKEGALIHWAGLSMPLFLRS